MINRPALRYHGGKYRLAPWVISHFPAHRVYVEPFGGAMSVLLRKPRCPGEVYNDLDGQVVSLFRVLQDPASAEVLRRRLHLTPFSRAEFHLSYKPTPDPIEAAARLVMRSFMGFGSDSATRANVTGFRLAASRQGFMGARRKDGGGQSPAVDWSTWPDCIPAFVDRLRGVVLECRPALDVIRQSDSAQTLHYLDPPYVVSTRRRVGKGRGYTHEMTDAEHRALAAAAMGVEGMVVLSGYKCPLYDELYGAWPSVSKAHLAQAARKSVETLWFNAAAYEALSVRQLL